MGFGVIYLTFVRASLVSVLISGIVYIVVMLIQGRTAKAILYLSVLGGVAVVSMGLAVALAGDAVERRFASLLEADPMTVYYTNRGSSIEHALTYLWQEYPFGGGIGGWGIAAMYFGGSGGEFAEIMINGWIIDGGLPLLILYLWALFATGSYELRRAGLATNVRLKYIAPVVVALNASTLALIFSFVPFVTQVGIQHWFMSAALHGAAYAEWRRNRK
jgi:hypothetical protein